MGIPRALRRSWEGGPFVMGKVSLTLANLLHVPEVVGVLHPLGKSVSYTSYTPLEDHPLATHRETSALYCWILETLYCNPKGRRALLRIPST